MAALQHSSQVPADRRRFCILGTAGHIDHGKSSLVKALSGTDPDRLPEEKLRGMTIELGFAHIEVQLPDGAGAVTVGLVDVPGHEKFIKTMVAGASGIDMAMLVVAADDGVMPQTREHVEILHLLGVDCGFIAISKADLANEERIAAVAEQIRSLCSGTLLAEWPIVTASARTGRGMDEVRRMIAALAQQLPAAQHEDIFRLAIDRVFPIQGRGTVVTGSVLAGSIHANTPLELLPAGIPCRVREIQSYGAAAQRAGPGQRAALNLTGVDRQIITRGMELATPGYLSPSRYVDAQMSLLARREKPLRTHQRVRVSMGTSEYMVTLVIIGGQEIIPGSAAFVQLRFQDPVVCAFGQRFIIRNETAQATLGGGIVLRPAARRLQPSDPNLVNSMRRSASPNDAERLEETLRISEFSIPDGLRLAALTGIQPGAISALLSELRSRGTLIKTLPEVEVHRDTLAAVERRALTLLQKHHAANPLEPGLLRDRFIGRLDRRGVSGLGKAICITLERSGKIVSRGPYVAHSEFRPALSPEDAALLEKIIGEITAAGFDPPPWSALRSLAGASTQRSKVMDDLARSDQRLLPLAPGQYISRSAVDKFKAVVSKIGTGRRFKLAEVRDALELSRRVVQPLLEYLDRVGFTRRVGDERILIEKAS